MINKILNIAVSICLFLLFIFPLHNKLFADYEPYKLSVEKEYRGGKIIFDIENEQKTAFFIPRDFTTQNNFIYKWDGFERIKAEGISLGTAEISDFFLIDSTIFVFMNNNNILHLSIYSKELTLLYTSNLFSIENYKNKSDGLIYLGKFEHLYNIFSWGEHCFYIQLDSLKFRFGLISDKIESAFIINNENTTNDTKQNNNELEENTKQLLALIERDAGISKFKIVDLNGNIKYFNTIDQFDIRKIEQQKNILYILSSTFYGNSTYLQLFDINTHTFVSNQWLNTSPDLFASSFDERALFAYFAYSDESNKIIFNSMLWDNEIKILELPVSLIEPQKLQYIKEYYILIFKNGIVKFNNEATILAIKYYPLSEYFLSDLTITDINDVYLLVSSNIHSVLLKFERNKFAEYYKFLDTSGKYVIPTVLTLLILLFVQLYRHQRRILKEILEMQTSGITIVLDKRGRLLFLNEAAFKFLGISYKIPRKKHFQYYCRDPKTEVLQEIVQKAFSYGSSINQKISILENNQPREWIVNLVILRNAAGILRGCVINAFDITEQFEKNRLYNWSQLAHDMKTNLSTIKLNAESLAFDELDANYKRKAAIIRQAHILIQRVRDIVTVGKSDKLELDTNSAIDICNEVINEFDDSLFPNIEFIVKAENFNINCDKAKLVRAFRNAIENSAKAINNKKGFIEISAYSTNKSAFFVIKDNGKGMDEETAANMMRPYFTKGGKGSGIGTMIMQQSIELHGGKIYVKSKKDEGTEISFEIPFSR